MMRLNGLRHHVDDGIVVFDAYGGDGESIFSNWQRTIGDDIEWGASYTNSRGSNGTFTVRMTRDQAKEFAHYIFAIANER